MRRRRPLRKHLGMAVLAAGAWAALASVAPAADAAQVIAAARAGRADVPRVELAARLAIAGRGDSAEFRALREDAAREVAGRPDGQGAVTETERAAADAAIVRARAVIEGRTPAPTLAELAHQSGRPQIPGLAIVYLTPLGNPADANRWTHILVHQTEGPAGSARYGATEQAKNPTRRGVTLWVETDGTVYWATSERAVPTHGDGANRNDGKYIDNKATFHAVVRGNTIGVEFAGNYPDVAKPASAEQERAWPLLMRFLQERYGIASGDIYAHNWIDFKDARYCEGCALAAAARRIGYVPGRGDAR